MSQTSEQVTLILMGGFLDETAINSEDILTVLSLLCYRTKGSCYARKRFSGSLQGLNAYFENSGKDYMYMYLSYERRIKGVAGA